MKTPTSKLTTALVNKIHDFLSEPGNCVPTYTDPVDGKVYYYNSYEKGRCVPVKLNPKNSKPNPAWFTPKK